MALVQAEGVSFVEAGGITITATIIMEVMAMAQPRTSTLTIMLQASNLNNREIISPMVLPFELHEIW